MTLKTASLPVAAESFRCTSAFLMWFTPQQNIGSQSAARLYKKFADHDHVTMHQHESAVDGSHYQMAQGHFDGLKITVNVVNTKITIALTPERSPGDQPFDYFEHDAFTRKHFEWLIQRAKKICKTIGPIPRLGITLRLIRPEISQASAAQSVQKLFGIDADIHDACDLALQINRQIPLDITGFRPDLSGQMNRIMRFETLAYEITKEAVLMPASAKYATGLHIDVNTTEPAHGQLYQPEAQIHVLDALSAEAFRLYQAADTKALFESGRLTRAMPMRTH